MTSYITWHSYFGSVLVICSQIQMDLRLNLLVIASVCALCPDSITVNSSIWFKHWLDTTDPMNEFPQQEMLLHMPENEQQNISLTCTWLNFKIRAFGMTFKLSWSLQVRVFLISYFYNVKQRTAERKCFFSASTIMCKITWKF